MHIMPRFSLVLLALVMATVPAAANDLLALYQLALTRDATLQAATFQRDAAIEARPQALSQLLPQLGAGASAARARRIPDRQLQSGQAAACEFSAASQMQHCYGNTHAVALPARLERQ
jgi:outer membrane protein TolC